MKKIEDETGTIPELKNPEGFFKESILPDIDYLLHFWKSRTSPSESVIAIIPKNREISDKKAISLGRKFRKNIIAKSKTHYSIPHIHDAKWYLLYGKDREFNVEI